MYFAIYYIALTSLGSAAALAWAAEATAWLKASGESEPRHSQPPPGSLRPSLH